ncbi:MAG: penicillin-binding protein activator [Desulfosalsimonas sp.]|uniref:penicillin-binding protein activator n=1 Tax=Desulfosalsimonas sp. TaxID=3073848 RepID=UPI0039704A3E
MNKKYSIGICLFLLVLVTACAPKDRPFRDIFKDGQPGQVLFEKAEQKYGQSAYSDAAELYSRYLEENPDGARAADARFKLGMIQMHTRDYGRARELFRDLIRVMPDSDAAGRARVGVMRSYMEQGDFQGALAYQSQLSEDRLDASRQLRVDLLAGDAWMALGRFDRAYEMFLSAFDRAGKPQRPQVGRRLLAAAFHMTPERIQAELDSLEGKPPSGYLMYQQAVRLAAEARIGDSLSVFQKFADQFPDHPLAAEAREEIQRISAQAFFKDNRVGCVLPLSGRYEVFGQRALKGLELAVYKAGSRMGISPPVQLLVRDSGSDPQTAKKAVQELADQGVAAIIGPMTGGSAPLAEAQEKGVPIIALSQKSGVTEAGAYVFRNFLTPEMQVDAVVSHAVQQLGCRRFAVLYPDEAYGETFFHQFWDQVLARGGRIVGAESYDPDQTDFAEPIQKLVGLYYDLPEELKPLEPDLAESESLIRTVMPESQMPSQTQWAGISPLAPKTAGDRRIRPEPEEDDKPQPIVDFDAVFIPDSPEKAGLIIPQLRYHDINEVYLLGTNLWHSPRMIQIAGRQLRRTVIPEGFFAHSQNPAVTEFVSDFEEIYGEPPGFIEAVAYDSAMMICRQLAEKKLANRPALQKALVEMSAYEGVTGKTRFLSSGEAEKRLYLLDVIDSRFVQIAP